MGKDLILIPVFLPFTVVAGWIYSTAWQALPDAYLPGPFAGGADEIIVLVLFFLLCTATTIAAWIGYILLKDRIVGLRSHLVTFMVSWIVCVALILNPFVFAAVFEAMY